ncbi:MAG: hypothetical protein JST12_07955 [Armatimonadetes bacterium]|nr:hypothetical protein [Armatimonadota bacterium]
MPPMRMSNSELYQALTNRINLDDIGMMKFRHLPPVHIGTGHKPYARTVGVAFGVVLAVALIKLFGRSLLHIPIIAVVAMVWVPSAWVTSQVSGILSRRAMREQAQNDAKELSARPGERHVGVSYCTHTWYFRSDSSWDRGFVRIEDACLVYRGYGPGFILPLSSVDRVEIQRRETSSQSNPRVYVHWTHPSSGPNVVCFEIRDIQDHADCVRKCAELQTWIQQARNRKENPSQPPMFPFESSSLSLPEDSIANLLEKTDLQLGTVAMVGCLVIGCIASVVIPASQHVLVGACAIGTVYGAFWGPIFVVRMRLRARGVPNV